MRDISTAMQLCLVVCNQVFHRAG